MAVFTIGIADSRRWLSCPMKAAARVEKVALSEDDARALRRFETRGDILQEAGSITIVRPGELRKRS